MLIPMKNTRFLAALLLALPCAAVAQTKSTSTTTTTVNPATQQQTEVTEDLDPATGKVIRRTTRTINVPVGTAPAPSSASPGSNRSSDEDLPVTAASDAQVTAFLRRKTTVGTLSTSSLLTAYEVFMDRVRSDRSSWKPSDWTAAAGILSSLNARYQQLRSSFSLDDKLTIRSQQAEFQALRTAKQISTQVSDKL